MENLTAVEKSRDKITNSSNQMKINSEFIAKLLGAKKVGKLYFNIKNPNRGLYHILSMEVKNCTNAQDGQEMVLYKLVGSDLIFVREKEEFFLKFKEHTNI